MHLVTANYGFFVFEVIAVGALIFAWSFLDLAKDGEDFQCDINGLGDKSGYSGLQSVFESIKDKQSCLDNIGKAFAILDLNGDHLLSRCEDAAFQVAMGSSEEYSKKFSAAYTLPTLEYFSCGKFEF